MKQRTTPLVATGLVFTLILLFTGCASVMRSSTSNPSSTANSSANGPAVTPVAPSGAGTGSSGGSSGGSGGSGSGGTSSGGTSSGGSGSGGSSGSSGGNSGGSGGTGNGGGSASPSQFLYVLENQATNNLKSLSQVQSFAINSSTGALTAQSQAITSGAAGDYILADNASKYLFVAYNDWNTYPNHAPQLFSEAIGSSGRLTDAGNQTFCTNDSDLNTMVFDSSGTNLYVSSNNINVSGDICQYTIDRTTGHFSATGTPVFSNSGRAFKLLLHPSGVYLYASLIHRHLTADRGGWALFLRNPATGALTDTGQVFYSGMGPTEYNDGVFASGGNYLVGVAGHYKISVFAVNPATGSLTVVHEYPGTYAGIAVDQSGKFVVASNEDGSVTSFQVNPDGSLNAVSTATASTSSTFPPALVAMDRSGKYVYVENASTSQIFAFTFDQSTGALGAVPGSPFATNWSPVALTTAGK